MGWTTEASGRWPGSLVGIEVVRAQPEVAPDLVGDEFAGVDEPVDLPRGNAETFGGLTWIEQGCFGVIHAVSA